MLVFNYLDPIHLKKLYVYIYMHVHTSVFRVKRFEESGPLKLLNKLTIHIHNEKKHMAQLYRPWQEMKNMEKPLRRNEEGADLCRIGR